MLLAALTLLAAPVAGRPGQVAAAVPDHQAQMMMSGHCRPAPSNGRNGHRSAIPSCCHSAFVPAAICPSAPDVAAPAHERPLLAARPAPVRVSFHGEIETPPPRSSHP